MELLAVILLFIFIIAGHEAGHALAARAFGVGIKKFSIGIGPGITIFRTKNFPVVFSPIILGGYIIMKSRYMPEEEQAAIAGTCYEDALYWKKMVILSAGVLMNLLTAVILLSILFIFFPGAEVQALGQRFVVRIVEEPYLAPLLAAKYTFALFGQICLGIVAAVPEIILNVWKIMTTLNPQAGRGLIGAFRGGAEAASFNAASFVFLGYFFSVIVAAFNILPLGFLDGGIMLTQTVEKIFGSGRPVKIAQTIIKIIGFVFLLSLLLLSCGSDIADVTRAVRSHF